MRESVSEIGIERLANTPARAGRTIVCYVLDESGSMEACRQAVIGGFAEYLDTLRKAPGAGQALFFLVKFNTVVIPVHAGLPLARVPDLTPETYRPGGMTALFDAVMTVVEGVDRVLTAADRVLVVVHTDGQENSSKGHDKRAVAETIRQREARGNWTFVFLGADQDAWSEGVGLGMAGANTASYRGTASGTREAYRRMSRGTSRWMASSEPRSDRFWDDDSGDEGEAQPKS